LHGHSRKGPDCDNEYFLGRSIGKNPRRVSGRLIFPYQIIGEASTEKKEIRSQRAEDRGQKDQRSGDGGQRTEDRRQESGDGRKERERRMKK
jgi:hypothetical protein